jgi:hypothetical protein
MNHFLIKLKMEVNITDKRVTLAREAAGYIPKKLVQALKGANIAQRAMLSPLNDLHEPGNFG